MMAPGGLSYILTHKRAFTRVRSFRRGAWRRVSLKGVRLARRMAPSQFWLIRLFKGEMIQSARRLAPSIFNIACFARRMAPSWFWLIRLFKGEMILSARRLNSSYT